MAIISIIFMLLSGSAHLEPATVYTVQSTSVTCEIGDGNLYDYSANNPQIAQGDSLTLVMTDAGEILAAW